MNTTLLIVILAMLAMANTAPVQEEQKNLQGLLDALTDQKTDMDSVAQAANLVKQQQDDDGSQEAEAQFFRNLARSIWANKQQDDNGNQVESQFFGKLARSLWANKQQQNQVESKNQEEDDGGDMKALMRELMKGVVAQVQEDEDQKSSTAELESKLDGLLSQIQDDSDDGDALSQEENDDLSALLQEDEEGDDGAQEQDDDDNGDDILAFLQDGDGFAEVQDEDDGDDATSQGWLATIHRTKNQALRICKKVKKYSRFVDCLPRMQAEMQKADDGDEDLAKDMLKRIANLQEEGGDDDAEAQFFRSVFRRARKFLRRPRKIYRKIRRGYSKIRRRFGRIIRGYRRVRHCMMRIG